MSFPLKKINIPDGYKKWLLLNYGIADSGEILAQEEDLAYQVGEGKSPPALEMWIASRECFVLGRYYAKRLKKQNIMNKLRERGTPLFFRSSGGEAILHDSTCLNFGAIVPHEFFPPPFDIGRAFLILSSGVRSCLKKMRIPVFSGKAKTFCPGPYDLLVEGKKIAGVSLLSRKNFCLVHGTLLVNSGREYFRKLKIFYPSLADEVSSLRNLTGKWIDMEDIAQGIIQGYRKSLKVSFVQHNKQPNTLY